MLQTVRVEKIDEENGVICLLSMFPSWVIILKLTKKGAFSAILPDFSMKSNLIECDDPTYKSSHGH